MTSPVSRDRLDAIRAMHQPREVTPGVWLPMPDTRADLNDLMAAAAYALDDDDRIAALEAERDHWRRLWEQAGNAALGLSDRDTIAAERDALRERVAALEAEVQRNRIGMAGAQENTRRAIANLTAKRNEARAERDALAATIAKVRALCEAYLDVPEGDSLDLPQVRAAATDLLAILDGAP